MSENEYEDMDELDMKLNTLFMAWRDIIDSEPYPQLVSDEDAAEIIKAAIGRPGVARRVMQWVFSR